MAFYVAVRGLERRPFRIGSKLVRFDRITFLDLDQVKERQGLSRHSALGSLVQLGSRRAAPGNIALWSGGAVTAGAARTVDVTEGSFSRANGTIVKGKAADELALAAADATNARIDLVTWDTNGNAVVTTGTAAATPAAPAVPANHVALAEVRLNAGATAPSTITDRRSFT